ncbi:MAG: PIN domain-containing protein [Verrucomicrobiota bacterium]|jgi:predicted nucleic acid-binding protein|nr:PIN domain-containing protein [Verrucomicrobiota bacterium]
MRFWDTSGLLALVLKDGHYRKACKWLTDDTEPHITSSIVAFEAENRLWALHLSGTLDGDDYLQRLTALRLLLSSKLIVVRNLRDTRSVTAESRRLVTVISPMVPHGTLDVLHVATAHVLKARVFHTFDRNQRSLANASGLVAP